MSVDDLPLEFKDVMDTFFDLLDDIPKDKRVLMILDSLDQLSPCDNAHDLAWLPKNLPTNVKLIVSTLPNEFNLLEKIRGMDLPQDNFIEAKALDSSVSHVIVDSWLQQRGRKLTAEQTELLNKALAQDVRPLYIKVIFDQVISWRSYDCGLSEIPDTIRGCLNQLYQNMEKKHGEILVARALGYLSLAKNGLTEIELEDLLSLDDTVLRDVFEFHVPPVRRLPSILWARIRHDLSEYIVEREADGSKVIAWYHRQFIETANERYHPCPKKAKRRIRSRLKQWRSSPDIDTGEEISLNERSRAEMITLFYDYFSGTWSNGKEKPFQYTEYQCKKLGLTNPKASADRHVTPQPVVFGQANRCLDVTKIRFNQRKISELPHILYTATKNSMTEIGYDKQADDIKVTLVQDLIFDLEFFTGWIATASWLDIVKVVDLVADDYSFNHADGEGATLTDEISLWRQTMLLAYTTLYNNPLMFGSAFAGRMLIYWNQLKWISDLLSQGDNEGLRLCALVAPHFQLETPGGELLYIINNHMGPVNDASWGDDEAQCYVSVSRKFVVIDLEQGDVTVDTRPRGMSHEEIFYRVVCQDEFVWVSTKPSPNLYCFGKKKGEVRRLIDLREHGSPSDYHITGLEKFECTQGSYLLAWSKGEDRIFCINLKSYTVSVLRVDLKIDLILTLENEIIVITEPDAEHTTGHIDVYVLYGATDRSKMELKRIVGAKLPAYGKMTTHAVMPGTRSFFLAFNSGELLHVAPWELLWIARMGEDQIQPSSAKKADYVYARMKEYTDRIQELHEPTHQKDNAVHGSAKGECNQATHDSGDSSLLPEGMGSESNEDDLEDQLQSPSSSPTSNNVKPDPNPAEESNVQQKDNAGDFTLDLASVLTLDCAIYAVNLGEAIANVFVAGGDEIQCAITVCLETCMKCYTVESTKLSNQPSFEVSKAHYKEAVISKNRKFLMCHTRGSGQLDIFR